MTDTAVDFTSGSLGKNKYVRKERRQFIPIPLLFSTEERHPSTGILGSGLVQKTATLPLLA
jgi:hypothetical protein